MRPDRTVSVLMLGHEHHLTTVACLTKTPDEYLATRCERRRKLAYQAILAAGDDGWEAGGRVRV
jgi:hypothetical protein